MKKFWPPTSKSSGSPYFLWQHEWDKHGKVYNYYQQEFNWSDMQGTAGQLEYYQAGIDLYKTFPYFQKVDSSAFTPDELARDLGLKKENFHLLCSHRNGRPANNHLREIQLCFSKTGSGVERKDLKFINCPPLSGNRAKQLCSTDGQGRIILPRVRPVSRQQEDIVEL